MPTDPNAKPSLVLKPTTEVDGAVVVQLGQELSLDLSWTGFPTPGSTPVELKGDGDTPIDSYNITQSEGNHTWSVQYAASHGGSYRAVGGGVESAPLEVTTAASPKPAPTTSTKVVELERGVYDPRFARWTGVGTLVLAACLLVPLAARWMTGSETGATITSSGVAVDTKAEQGFVALASVTTGVAALALLIGAWLAGLETRGRLLTASQEADRPPHPNKGARGEIGEIGDAAGKILTLMTVMRGSIAIISAGMMLLVAALVTSCQVAVSSHPTPSSSTSATTPAASSAPASPAAATRTGP